MPGAGSARQADLPGGEATRTGNITGPIRPPHEVVGEWDGMGWDGMESDRARVRVGMGGEECATKSARRNKGDEEWATKPESLDGFTDRFTTLLSPIGLPLACHWLAISLPLACHSLAIRLPLACHSLAIHQPV